MKPLRYILHLTVAIGIAFPSFATTKTSGLDSPITKAVMEVYQKQLEANPQDYETYFRRANEYYRHNAHGQALDDINNALKYTPTSESDMLFQQYSLRASIYNETGKPKDAQTDLAEALKIEPNSYVTVYQKANVDFELGDYANAKAGYLRLQRINNRSQEALFGLARIAVMERNFGLATDYANQAVEMTPSNSDVYTRRASVYRLMGNNQAAVDDLIMALATDQHETKALKELVDMSNSDYASVMSGLGNAIRQAPRTGMFYYIRATIAQAHAEYAVAIADYEKIIDDNLYHYAGLYASLAECHYALCDFDKALNCINQALTSAPTNTEYHTIESRILKAKEAARPQ